MKLKKFAATFLVVAIAASAFTCFASAEDINVSGHGWVGIGPDSVNASAGSTVHWHVFDVNDMPKQIDLPATWSVSDSSIASIIGNGSSATMTVHKNCSSVDVKATIDGQTTVQTYKTYWDDNANKATAVNLNTNAVTITGKGNTASVHVDIPFEYPGQGQKYGDSIPSVYSSNNSVATVRLSSDWNDNDSKDASGNLIITAKGAGTCTVTVKTASGPSASCKVMVNGVSAGGGTTTTKPSTPAKPATPTTPAKPSAETTSSTPTKTTVTKNVTNPTTGKQEKITKTTTTDPKTGKKTTTTTVTDPQTGKTISSSTSSVPSVNSSATSSVSNNPAALVVSDPSSDDSAVSSINASPTVPATAPASNHSTVWIIVGCVAAGVILAAVAIALYRKRNRGAGEDTGNGVSFSEKDDTAPIDIKSSSDKSKKK